MTTGQDRYQRSPAPAPGIDPRLRQRRIEVRRHQGRQRLRIVAAALAVPALAGLAFGATRSPLLDVDHVEVRGARHTPPAAVVAIGDLRGHRAMWGVDTGRVAGRVEALPWVLQATARRHWPATVRIEVVERRASAAVPVAAGQRWAVVDPGGRVLEVVAAKPDRLPVLGGLGEPGAPGTSLDPSAAAALQVAARLPASLRAAVGDVATVDGGAVELHLVPAGVLVRLGGPEALGAKLAALQAVLDQAPLGGVAVVDLRVPEAPVLTRR